jgi:hypothetical protein
VVTVGLLLPSRYADSSAVRDTINLTSWYLLEADLDCITLRAGPQNTLEVYSYSIEFGVGEVSLPESVALEHYSILQVLYTDFQLVPNT